ncbi:MAG: hypothetical protein QOD96_5182 [Pseudonocardiales bacterium]|nr:hypothetical protein [Pseudonocardiales bacterium]
MKILSPLGTAGLLEGCRASSYGYSRDLSTTPGAPLVRAAKAGS